VNAKENDKKLYLKAHGTDLKNGELYYRRHSLPKYKYDRKVKETMGKRQFNDYWSL